MGAVRSGRALSGWLGSIGSFCVHCQTPCKAPRPTLCSERRHRVTVAITALRSRRVRRIMRSLARRSRPTTYAAETGGAVTGLRVAAITSGRKVSSRGGACFCPDFG